MRRVLVLWFLLLPALAHAQVTVTVTPSADGAALATQLGLSTQALADQIKARLDDAYNTAHVDNFLRGFADATSFSMRGIGVDYMSVPHSLIIGVGGQVAVAATSDVTSNQHPTAGLAANVSLMAGLNLGDWGHPRWTLFANGFYRNGSTQQLHGGITTAGAHLQYRLIQPEEDSGIDAKLLRWTGIDVTSGFEFTRWTLGAKIPMSNDFTVDGTSGSTALTLDSTGTFDLSSNAATVPIEITTGVRIALLVSLYVGAGIDLTAGKSAVNANLNGNVHTSDMRDIGAVSVTGAGNNTASPGSARGLAGVQLNLWKLKVYAQVNASVQPAASVGFGVRLVL